MLTNRINRQPPTHFIIIPITSLLYCIVNELHRLGQYRMIKILEPPPTEGGV